MKLHNKVIWITGGSSGIGEATAYAAIKKGAKVIVSSNQKDELEQVAENCRKKGGEAKALFLDLTDMDAMPKIVDEAYSYYGSIDVLYNNGGLSQRAFVLDAPLDIQRKIMEINYFGAINLTRLVLPRMLEKGKGQIAVTTSIAGKFGAPGRSAYCAAKHALYGFFETLRAEYCKQGIGVTFLCPGRVQTNISLHALDKDGKPTGKMDAGLAGGIPVEKAAAKIIRSIEKDKKDVLIGGKELLMVYFKKFIPFLYYKMIPNIKN